MKDQVAKDPETNSQVSAITFMYTSSSLNSKKRAKDGIQQMNEASSRFSKNRLAKLQNEESSKKKDAPSSKRTEASKLSRVSKAKVICDAKVK